MRVELALKMYSLRKMTGCFSFLKFLKIVSQHSVYHIDTSYKIHYCHEKSWTLINHFGWFLFILVNQFCLKPPTDYLEMIKLFPKESQVPDPLLNFLEVCFISVEMTVQTCFDKLRMTHATRKCWKTFHYQRKFSYIVLLIQLAQQHVL